tara:strand:+ start:226 stop:561 length:336 start_codon:yes stop_codon:yes gene_type:complete
MPAINLRTSVTFQKQDELLKTLSNELSSLTGKPETYVMTSLETGVAMSFGGTLDPCCYVEVKSIGSLQPAKMSESLCQIISSEMGIPLNRIYIEFADIEAKFWGWNGSTFG